MGLFWGKKKNELDNDTLERIKKVLKSGRSGYPELLPLIEILKEKESKEGDKFLYLKELSDLQHNYQFYNDAIQYWNCSGSYQMVGDYRIAKPLHEFYLEHLEDLLKHSVKDVTVSPRVVVAFKTEKTVTERRKVNEIQVIDGIKGHTSGGSFSGSSYKPSYSNRASYSGSFSGTSSKYEVKSHREDVYADVDRMVIETNFKDYTKSTFTEAIQEAKNLSQHPTVLNVYVVARLFWKVKYYCPSNRDILIETYEFGSCSYSSIEKGTPTEYELGKRYWVKKEPNPAPSPIVRESPKLSESPIPTRYKRGTSDFWSKDIAKPASIESYYTPTTNLSFDSYKENNFTFDNLPGYNGKMLEILMKMDINSTDDLKRAYNSKREQIIARLKLSRGDAEKWDELLKLPEKIEEPQEDLPKQEETKVGTTKTTPAKSTKPKAKSANKEGFEGLPGFKESYIEELSLIGISDRKQLRDLLRKRKDVVTKNLSGVGAKTADKWLSILEEEEE